MPELLLVCGRAALGVFSGKGGVSALATILPVVILQLGFSGQGEKGLHRIHCIAYGGWRDGVVGDHRKAGFPEAFPKRSCKAPGRVFKQAKGNRLEVSCHAACIIRLAVHANLFARQARPAMDFRVYRGNRPNVNVPPGFVHRLNFWPGQR